MTWPKPVLLGIVGSEAAKFTAATEQKARQAIRDYLATAGRNGERFTGVTSGGCHLGGIDIWAVEEARALGLTTTVFLPKRRSWEGGYKERNMQIATLADTMLCITVRELPEGYTGMRFPLCYHCGTKDHIKSGGCWTVKQARTLGKPGAVIVINP